MKHRNATFIFLHEMLYLRAHNDILLFSNFVHVDSPVALRVSPTRNMCVASLSSIVIESQRTENMLVSSELYNMVRYEKLNRRPIESLRAYGKKPWLKREREPVSRSCRDDLTVSTMGD